MIPNCSWNLESWQNSGLSEIWYCGRSAGKRRTVRRSCDLFTRGSAEKFLTANFLPRTVRQRTADGPPVLGRIYQRQFQSVGNVKIQRRTVRQDTADSPRMDKMVGSAGLDL